MTTALLSAFAVMATLVLIACGLAALPVLLAVGAVVLAVSLLAGALGLVFRLIGGLLLVLFAAPFLFVGGAIAFAGAVAMLHAALPLLIVVGIVWLIMRNRRPATV